MEERLENRLKNSLGGVSRRNFFKTLVGGAAISAYSLSKLNAAMYQSITSLNQKYIQDESPDGIYWDSIRKYFLLEEDLIMMNNGTTGPLPKPVFNTIIKYYKVQATNPYNTYNYVAHKIDDVRLKLARFINASPGEVVMTRNTTEGINFVANGLDLMEGDEVLISNMEHPAGIQPWILKEKRYGIKVREVPMGLPPKGIDEIVNSFKKAISPRTKVICISSPIFLSGLMSPLHELSELAHKRDIMLVADCAHALGMLNLDVKKLGVDFLASSAYKWLGAPTGCGLLYVRKEVMSRIWPTIVSYDWAKVDTAQKFSFLGVRAWPLVLALGEAIEFQTYIGKDRIERRIKSLAGHLKKELSKMPDVKVHTPQDPYLSGGLTVFSIKGVEPDKIESFLREKYNIVVRRAGSKEEGTAGVRVSTHYYISFKQVDLLLEGIKHLAANKA